MASHSGNGLVSLNRHPSLTNDRSQMYGIIAVTIITVIALLWTTYKVRFWKVRDKDLKEEDSKLPVRDKELKEEDIKLPDRAIRLFIRFSVDELRSATRNFSDALVIGKGGFGKVYKGVIGDGQLAVAIKRSKAYSRDSRHAFLTEIKIFCEVRHMNLVSLIGYCNENREMILVYEYMSGGTLRDHLHKYSVDNDSDSFLTWKQRLNICIGAAQGLDYLHTGHRIIHHDVKTSNILLDENFTAKVADFGLAKSKPDGESELKSDRLRGTFGYFDPHYITTHILTRKGDTYAFGVVLLEVLCERPALDRMAEGEERSLAKWAQHRINEGKVDEIVTPSLIGQVFPDSLDTFVEVAQTCLDEEPKKRPTMAQVVVKLELALEQQDGRNLPVPNRERKVADVQTVTLSAVEQTSSNQELQVTQKDEETIDMYLSCLWAKGGHKRIKPTKKNYLVFKAKSTKEKELIRAALPPEISQANIRTQVFDFAYIEEAIKQFSPEIIIGQGGFGSVYKGVLPTGQMIAVKRLSFSSRRYGLEEFKCEILWLSALQHCNVIVLLGYCVSGEERMLVYEFMENRSLDYHINDETRRSQLDWALRFKIIVGVVKGMIYLHQDSGMRIIHRDIKPSNILLDANMNPKICDFGLAFTLILEDFDSLNRIAGTMGYMAPEYMMNGHASIMMDVFGFGVLILVTLSGKLPHCNADLDIILVEYAWELWNQGRELDLVDSLIRGSASKEEALRCIQVGLLCTQKKRDDRPTMTTVLKILKGEEEPLMDLHDKKFQHPLRNISSDISSMTDEVIGVDEVPLDLCEIDGMPGLDTADVSSTMATTNTESSTKKEKVSTNEMTSKSKTKHGIGGVIASIKARMGGSTHLTG